MTFNCSKCGTLTRFPYGQIITKPLCGVCHRAEERDPDGVAPEPQPVVNWDEELRKLMKGEVE